MVAVMELVGRIIYFILSSTNFIGFAFGFVRELIRILDESERMFNVIFGQELDATDSKGS